MVAKKICLEDYVVQNELKVPLKTPIIVRLHLWRKYGMNFVFLFRTIFVKLLTTARSRLVPFHVRLITKRNSSV